ncbi:hypothetical protein ABZT16_44530 [Streptomyces flaveolus]|uniref:hypothetical protein n=1 Tax=Streptomyces flaveolus TaxID=67297 RepID=UPI0033A2ECDD
MPYLIPSRAPLTPEQVEEGFDYLSALQLGGEDAATGRAEADPELAFVLLRLAEDIVWPVTAVDGESDPCADSFALDEVGCVLLSALRDWARDSPTTAVPGTARSIIRFTANVIPDPDHPDTADTLEAMRAAGRLGAPGALHRMVLFGVAVRAGTGGAAVPVARACPAVITRRLFCSASQRPPGHLFRSA